MSQFSRSIRCIIRYSVFVILLHFSTIPNALSDYTTLPLTGVWNGFLEQYNVVECSNLTDSTASLLLTVIDYNRNTLGTTTINIAARGTAHTALNAYSITNSYGVYRVENAAGDPAPSIFCQTSFYRSAPAGAPKVVDYAFAMPTITSLYGNATGVYNSMNPSYGSRPVYNYLSILNPGERAFSGRVEVYNQQGSYDSSQSFRFNNLAPLERRDYPLGHQIGQVVGTYVVIPNDLSQGYSTFITRYAQNDEGGFDFAIPILGLNGICDPGPIPASTMNPANNWGEVSNPNSWAEDVTIRIMDRYGNELFNETKTLAPFSQHHVYINSVLGENNVGTFHATCRSPLRGDSILAQSFYYGRLNAYTNDVEWAYASQGKGALLGGSMNFAVQLDTNYNAPNWLKILDAGNQAVTFDYDIANANGTTTAQGTSSMPANGSVDIGLHEQAGYSYYGLGLFFPRSVSGLFYPELVRVFPHSSGAIGYIMNVPAAATSLTQSAPIGDADRTAVLNDYYNNYLTSEVASGEFTWNGSVSTCSPGTVPDSVHAKVVKRINYFRRQVSLPDDVTLDSTKNAKCQQASLMMRANGQLSHTPPSSWNCYTADGYEAASHSNLTLGYIITTIGITALMGDDGSNNTAVGHRRWFLYPRAKIMGHGSTDGSMAVWVIGDFGATPTSMPEFVSWPPKGYVPSPFVFARWSFSIPDTNFDATTISMTDPDGNPVALTQNPVAYGYGDSTIVWEPTGIITTSPSDLTYQVSVNNAVVSGTSRNYNYSVTIIQP